MKKFSALPLSDEELMELQFICSVGVARVSSWFNAVSRAEKVIRTVGPITLIKVVTYVMP